MEANRNAKNISVFVLTKDGTNQIIGQIKQQKNSSNKRYNLGTVVNTPIKQVNDFNMYILDYIKKDIIHPPGANFASIQTFNVIFIDDIIGIIFKKNQMRKGNIYFVLQKSTKGIRFLCYLVPYENHSSIALGSQFNYSIQDAKKGISEELPVLIDKLSKFGSIYPFFQNGPSRFNVNRNFGI
jgi:hypothetical protein